MIDVYETWDESWDESGIRTTTATDAPDGVRLVKADEYDRLRKALERMVHESQHITGKERLRRAQVYGEADPGDELRRLYDAQCDAEQAMKGDNDD